MEKLITADNAKTGDILKIEANECLFAEGWFFLVIDELFGSWLELTSHHLLCFGSLYRRPSPKTCLKHVNCILRINNQLIVLKLKLKLKLFKDLKSFKLISFIWYKRDSYPCRHLLRNFVRIYVHGQSQPLIFE